MRCCGILLRVISQRESKLLDLLFLVRFRCRRSANTFQLPGKPLKPISSNHTWLTYGCGKIFWHPSRWPWVKVTKLPKRDSIYFVPTIKWEPLIQSLQNLVVIFPFSGFPPVFWRNSVKNRFLANLYIKFQMRFSQVEHSICHILGMVGPIDVKKKEMSRLSTNLDFRK